MSFENKIITAILVAIACLFIIPAILMWLWNSCVVGCLPVGEIESYWQAMGIYVVSNILFKNSRSSNSKE